jgi:prophage antirepressor-like protein
MDTNLNFNGLSLAVVMHCGQEYLTLTEVARALYAQEGGPQSATPSETRVRDLFRRHADEFTDSMTALVRMQTAGGMQEVRIFSLRGCHLLGMFARTECAKQFRRWVLDVLEQRGAPQTMPVEFQKALVEYTSKRAVASLCGRGLKRWQGEKNPLEARVNTLASRLQIALPI